MEFSEKFLGDEPYNYLLMVPSRWIETTVAISCGYFLQDVIFGIRTQIPSWRFDIFHHIVSSIGLCWAPVRFHYLDDFSHVFLVCT